MRRKFLFLLTALSLATAAEAGAQTAPERGRHELRVGDFTKLSVADGINVEYVCCPDSAGMAVLDSTGMPGNIIFDNNSKGKLRIYLSTDIAMSPPRGLPTVRVYSQSLKEVTNNADSAVVIISACPAEKIKLTQVGNGRITARNVEATTVEARIATGCGVIEIAGRCGKARLRCTGTGAIDAGRLESGRADCTIVGTGTIRCWVESGPINVSGTGTGKVYYLGSPTGIRSRQLGSIKTLPAAD